MNLKLLSLDLKKRISELPRLKNGKIKYSVKIKGEIISLAHQYESASVAAKHLGVSSVTLLKWVHEEKKTVLPPRKLQVEKENSIPLVNSSLIEVVLSNGIILRHVPLSVASLNLLRGVL